MKLVSYFQVNRAHRAARRNKSKSFNSNDLSNVSPNKEASLITNPVVHETKPVIQEKNESEADHSDSDEVLSHAIHPHVHYPDNLNPKGF